MTRRAGNEQDSSPSHPFFFPFSLLTLCEALHTFPEADDVFMNSMHTRSSVGTRRRRKMMIEREEEEELRKHCKGRKRDQRSVRFGHLSHHHHLLFTLIFMSRSFSF